METKKDNLRVQFHKTIKQLDLGLECAEVTIYFARTKLYPNRYQRLKQRLNLSQPLSNQEQQEQRRKLEQLEDLREQRFLLLQHWSSKYRFYEHKFPRIIATPISDEEAFQPKELRKQKGRRK